MLQSLNNGDDCLVVQTQIISALLRAKRPVEFGGITKSRLDVVKPVRRFPFSIGSSSVYLLYRQTAPIMGSL